MEHELKTWPQYFEAVLNGNKRFEYRINDRNYQPGDVLCLREYLSEQHEYTGREMYVNVLDVYSEIPGKPVSYVIMNIEPRDMTNPPPTPTFGSNPYFFVEGGLFDRHGREVDPGECIIFKVTDQVLPAILASYSGACEARSPQEHVERADKLRHEIHDWQLEHPDRVKPAD